MPPPNYLYYRDRRAATFGRTARTAYWINNPLAGNVPPDPPEALPEGTLTIPDFARAPRRAGNTAYWIPNLLEGNVGPPEEMPEGQQAVTDFARAARRAGNTAYWIDNLLEGNVPPEPAEDLPEGERALLPSRAPGPRRTAAAVYWIDTSFVLNILTGRVEPPESTYRQMIPDRAPGPRRAANSAYWLDNFLAGNVPGETLPEGKLSIPDFGRAPRRARNTAYWLPNWLEGNVPADPPEQLPEGQAMGMAGSDFARDAVVAVPYWPSAFVISIPVELPEGESLMPDRAPGPRRAGNTAYWIDNLLEGNVPPEPPPPSVGVRTGTAFGLIVRNRVG